MPCERYNFDECVQLHGLDNFGTNDTDAKFDKKLLCVPKDAKVVEIISFASFAIVAYVICKLCAIYWPNGVVITETSAHVGVDKIAANARSDISIDWLSPQYTRIE